MRAKFINEKFTEEGDPISDLGIGYWGLIKKWAAEHSKNANDIKDYQSLFRLLVLNKKLEFADFLLKFKGDEINIDFNYCSLLRLAGWSSKYEEGLFLIKNGANLENAIFYAKIFNETLTLQGLHTIKKMIERKNVNEKIKESLYEKFIEDSDPIKDLGIGTKLYQTLKKWDVIQIKKQIGNGFNFPGEGYYILVTNVAKMKVRNKGSNSDTDITYVLFNKDKDKLLKTLKSRKINPDSERTWYMNQKFFNRHFNIIDKKELKESLNEKFTEDGDPIHDMGIGIYIKRNFTDKKDFFDKLVLFLPVILKRKTIPKDILLHGGYINHTYFLKIIDFLEKYWTFDNISIRIDFCEVYTWPKILHNILIAKGYKPYLNEKFTEDSDPIHDMNIGLINEIKKWITINIVQRITGDDRGHDYTIDDFHINNDLSIDVYNRLDISWEDLEKAPEYIKFNHIKGDFYSWFNEEDTIKNNGPRIVDEDYEIFYRGKLKITEDIVRKYCKVKGEVHITKTT